MGMFGITSPISLSMVESLTQTFRMPYVTPTCPGRRRRQQRRTSFVSPATAAAVPTATTEATTTPATAAPWTAYGGVRSRGGGGLSTAGYMLYLHPLYHRAVVELINFHSWSHLHYVYDSVDGKVLADGRIDERTDGDEGRTDGRSDDGRTETKDGRDEQTDLSRMD